MPQCKHCKQAFDDRVKRAAWVKTFLFWLPVKRYVCYKCNKKTYVFG
jgi:hypothetical protein